MDKSLVDEDIDRKHKLNENIATQGNFSCDVCEQTFLKNSIFQFHICKPDIKFACESCSFISLTATELLTHVQSYHVPQKPEMREHTKTKLVEPFPCEACGLMLASFNLLQEHVGIHHSPVPQSCQQCDKTFKDKEDLGVHMIECHQEVVIFHTMAKQVDDLTDKFENFETFQHDVKSLLKSLLDNQISMKQQMSVLRNCQTDGASKMQGNTTYQLL